MIKGQEQNQTQMNSREDVKAINTTIMLLTQKIGYLVKNEKVLSKNIIILNEKIKKIDQKVDNFKSEGGSNIEIQDNLDSFKAQIEELYLKIKGIKQEIFEMQNSISNLNDKFATKADINELKYILDAVNPLEYVTYRQLKEYIKKD